MKSFWNIYKAIWFKFSNLLKYKVRVLSALFEIIY